MLRVLLDGSPRLRVRAHVAGPDTLAAFPLPRSPWTKAGTRSSLRRRRRVEAGEGPWLCEIGLSLAVPVANRVVCAEHLSETATVGASLVRASAPQNRDQRTDAQSVPVMAGLAHDEDDFFDPGRVCGVLHPFVSRGATGEVPRPGGWRPPAAGGVEQHDRIQDKTGTDESSRRAAEWVKENGSTTVDPPAITEGDAVLQF